VKAERSISFIEARKIVSAESEGRPAQGGCTTAAVVASKSGPIQPTTRSLQVRTDLTWPERQKVPPFSLPLQAQHANTLTLPQTSSQATILANDSLVKAHPSTSNENNFNAPHGKPPDEGKKDQEA